MIGHSGACGCRQIFLKFWSAFMLHESVPPKKMRLTDQKRHNPVFTRYIPMSKGFVYLTAVVDVASRLVLAHKVAITLGACRAKEIIEQAFARYGKPEIVNTDQGSQFTAEEFTKAVQNQGCKLSLDGHGAWGDNVFVERLWRSVKYERVYLMAYDSVGAARTNIAQTFDWYNSERSHSSLDRVAPAKVYLSLLPKLAEAA